MDIGTHDLGKHKPVEAIESLDRWLTEKFGDELEAQAIDFVNIEQQPPQFVFRGKKQKHWYGKQTYTPPRDNTVMKCMQHGLQAWFLAHGVPVQFVSPKCKLNVYQGPPITLSTRATSEYTIRKQTAVAQAIAILHELPDSDMHVHRLRAMDKADDAADAFLQACYSLREYV